MKDRLEKRRYPRLTLAYDISCRRVGSEAGKSYDGHTVNVSSGGLYFETGANVFERGDLLKLVLDIPPTVGRLEFGGELAGYANVLRSETIAGDRSGNDPACARCGVAVEFCRPPKLSS